MMSVSPGLFLMLLRLRHSLYNSNIGDEGAAAIGKALTHNKTLTDLS